MPCEPFERIPLGRTGLSVTRLGFGTASIAGLYAPVAGPDAISLVDHAWDIRVRAFDVAPLYGSRQARTVGRPDLRARGLRTGTPGLRIGLTGLPARRQVVEAAHRLTGSLSDSERAAIFGATAYRAYRLADTPA
jgi:hypothetical protein